MPIASQKILVGLSGWVDSAVSALLLKEAGHQVSAGFMVNYIRDDESCPTREDIAEAERVAKHLGIPFHTFDFVDVYEKRIVEMIYDGYAKGITPNPDVFCNSLVKFGIFMDEARSYGFDAIATGHYARIEQDEQGFNWLKKGVDPNKDQSYFLSRLNQEQLAHSLFPIWHLPKPQVREIARTAWLPNAERKDSQWICFIGKVGMQAFLRERIPPQEGNIVDSSGKILGTHQGVWNFTIGQRKGIAIGGGPALFVIHKDKTSNTVTVWGEEELDLYSRELIATEWEWKSPAPIENAPLGCKIRYRQEDQACSIEPADGREQTVRIRFDQSQRAITSGQIAVAYQGDSVVGSGIIE